jgi:hypothetical protein
MANQTGIKAFWDKLKVQIAAYQQVLSPPKAPSQRPLKSVSRQEVPDQYPGLLLEIGAELLITDEIVKIYRGLSNSLGRVVIIDQIATPEDETIKASAFGIQVYVEPKMARQMRAAYLQREQAAS